MENVKISEEVRYCTSCGAANKKSAHTCSECKNKMHKKHRPFFEFLKRRVKGWGFDKAKGKIYDLIKEFLYSHLYGIVLTVSVVTTGSIVLSNSTPYIKTVTESPFTFAVEEEAEESGLDSEDVDWCQKHAIYMMSHYIDHSEAVIWAHEGYTVAEDEYYIVSEDAEVDLNLYIPAHAEKITVTEFLSEDEVEKRDMLPTEYNGKAIKVKKGEFDYITVSSVKEEKTTDTVKIYVK